MSWASAWRTRISSSRTCTRTTPGLAAELAAPETRVYINREDGDRLESFRVAKNTLRMEEYSMLGFSREEMDFLQDSPMRKFSSVKKAEFTHISDGDTLEYGGGACASSRRRPHARPRLPL